MRSFACFAAERGDSHVRAVAATAWAGAASTSGARSRRLGAVIRLARFLRAEDPAHEIPATDIYAAPRSRPVPYIYSADELARILDAASLLRRQRPNPLRRQLYVMLFGLIAATGLRVSEALALQFDDVLPGGILHIRATKFGKSRLVPMHATVVETLSRYIELRRGLVQPNDHLFLGVTGEVLDYSAVQYTFRCVVRSANIAPDRPGRLASMTSGIASPRGCFSSAEPIDAPLRARPSHWRHTSGTRISRTRIGISRPRRS